MLTCELVCRQPEQPALTLSRLLDKQVCQGYKLNRSLICIVCTFRCKPEIKAGALISGSGRPEIKAGALISGSGKGYKLNGGLQNYLGSFAFMLNNFLKKQSC